MPDLKLMSYNIEWMISVFGGAWTDWDGTIPASFPGKSLGSIKLEKIDDVDRLCRRIAGVITAADPHILAVQEGPPRQDQLQLFADRYLGGNYTVFASKPNNQCLHFMVRNDIVNKVTVWDPMGAELEALRAKQKFYPWGAIAADAQIAKSFARLPLVLTFNHGSKSLRVINVHTKSKFSKLKRLSQWENREPEAIMDALQVRQQLSAEIAALRAFVAKDRKSTSRASAYVVMGDFNDGPYAELMEREFLIHNIIDEMAGTFVDPASYLQHAMSPTEIPKHGTVSFPDPLEGGRIVEELIDHILVSSDIWLEGGPFRVKANSGKVEMAAHVAQDDTGSVRKRGDRPSDHRPVSTILTY